MVLYPYKYLTALYNMKSTEEQFVQKYRETFL